MMGILKRANHEQSTIEIIYMSKGGIVSGRLIKVLEIKGNTVIAYCYLRKKRRTFLIENILSADVPRRRGRDQQAN
jgi:predicted DNA-binding transcriptional regulator YafY